VVVLSLLLTGFEYLWVAFRRASKKLLLFPAVGLLLKMHARLLQLKRKKQRCFWPPSSGTGEVGRLQMSENVLPVPVARRLTVMFAGWARLFVRGPHWILTSLQRAGQTDA